MQKYLYNYYKLSAKAAYHLRMDEVLTMAINNEPDPHARKKVSARRSHHRRMYRKYHAEAERVWSKGN